MLESSEDALCCLFLWRVSHGQTIISQWCFSYPIHWWFCWWSALCRCDRKYWDSSPFCRNRWDQWVRILCVFVQEASAAPGYLFSSVWNDCTGAVQLWSLLYCRKPIDPPLRLFSNLPWSGTSCVNIKPQLHAPVQVLTSTGAVGVWVIWTCGRKGAHLKVSPGPCRSLEAQMVISRDVKTVKPCSVCVW